METLRRIRFGTIALNALIILPLLYVVVSIIYGIKNYHILEGKNIYFSFYGSLALLIIPAIFAKGNVKTNYTLTIVTSTFCVFLGEAALEVASHQHSLMDDPIFADNRDAKDRHQGDSPSPDDIHAFRARDIEAWPVLNWKSAVEVFRTDDFFPLSGISNVFTVNCREGGPFATYVSDRYGFNNPDREYAANSHDFMLVGDSFTHGNCVPEGKDTASVLRTFGLKGLSVGYGGTGPLSQLGTVIEYAPITKPKYLIWLFFEGNDIPDYYSEMKRRLLPNYIKEKDFHQKLSIRQNEIDDRWKEFVEKKLNAPKPDKKDKSYGMPNLVNTFFHIENILKLRNVRNLIGTKFKRPFPCMSFLPEHSALLVRAQRVIQKWNGRIVFVYLASDLGRDAEDYPCKAAIIDNVRNMGVETLDFESVLRKHDNEGPFQSLRGGHYNEAGYRLLASKIAELLK